MVLSLVRDILELNYCTKLFHRTVHALSAQLCKTRRTIGVSRGKHHSNKTAFSIAFFAAFFPHFSAFFANPGDRIPPPPPCPIWVLLGGGGGWHPRRLEHNLLMQFSNLGSSRMVVPLPSLRCLAEGNRIFWSTKIGQFFSPNISQMMTFLNPLAALIPKIPFSFFADFWVWVTSGARGSV